MSVYHGRLSVKDISMNIFHCTCSLYISFIYTDRAIIYLGVIKITHSILIGSLTFGFLALLTSLFASFHKTSVLVTATVALEITSGKALTSITAAIDMIVRNHAHSHLKPPSVSSSSSQLSLSIRFNHHH